VSNNSSPVSSLTNAQAGVLLFSILIVALCGIVYELIIGTVSSYLLGNSVYQFSLTIGFFMFAMGLGSWISKFFDKEYIRNFVTIEVAIALVGGISSTLLFMAFPFARPLYELTMYTLILIIGALVGMEIPILTALLSQKNEVRDSIANVMSLDYLGALIGSVAFPLLLLPSLGLVQSSFAIGLINILVATVNVFIFRKHLKNFQNLLFACITILVMLFIFIVYGSHITRFAEKQLYFDQIVYSKQTKYQKLVVTRSTSNRDQRLYIDGHIQFSSRDEYRYHEYLVHPVLSIPGEVKNVLILGGGDGLAARETLKHRDIEQIHLVDIDPEMLRIGTELPMLTRLNNQSMSSEKLTAFAEDAFSFINQPGVMYDRVIIDMPDQSSSPFFTRNVYWSIESTLDAVFENTYSYQTSLPSFGIWGFHMASNQQQFPSEWSFDIETKSLTTETMRASSIFGKDIAKLDAPVNSIMEPKLYQLYVADLKK